MRTFKVCDEALQQSDLTVRDLDGVILVDGKPDAAAAMFRNGLKIYPLAKAANPPAMKFLNGSKQSFNTVHANTASGYHVNLIRCCNPG